MLDYYTFAAELTESGTAMVGNITTGGRKFGAFAAQKVGCPPIVTCTPDTPPSPGPPSPPTPGPPPPPPSPPPPHPPVPVWPLPLDLKCTPRTGIRTGTAAYNEFDIILDHI